MDTKKGIPPKFYIDRLSEIVDEFKKVLNEKLAHKKVKYPHLWIGFIETISVDDMEIMYDKLKNIQNIRSNNILIDKITDVLMDLEKELSNKKSELMSMKTMGRAGTLTFWDIYLFYLRIGKSTSIGSNWNDVEKQILDFFVKKDFKIMNDSFTGYEIVKKIIENKNIEQNREIKILEKLLKDTRVISRSVENINDLLYRELVEFSKNFINYLNDIYNECYRAFDSERSRWNFIDKKIADSQDYELLNFNYTNAKGDRCKKQINIHGDKDDWYTTPIIGINAEDLTFNKDAAFKMTKQYQLILNEKSNMQKLDLENINKIIFYGHSLALADYQYFKNIFDRVNLVKSSIQLVFKYSNGYENHTSIFKLLNRYSKDIGMDVVTTLILENRLKLQEI